MNQSCRDLRLQLLQFNAGISFSVWISFFSGFIHKYIRILWWSLISFFIVLTCAVNRKRLNYHHEGTHSCRRVWDAAAAANIECSKAPCWFCKQTHDSSSGILSSLVSLLKWKSPEFECLNLLLLSINVNESTMDLLNPGSSITWSDTLKGGSSSHTHTHAHVSNQLSWCRDKWSDTFDWIDNWSIESVLKY